MTTARTLETSRVRSKARTLVLWSVTILFMMAALHRGAAAYDVTLIWHPPSTNADGTPLTDLAGYRVYYGTASREYSHATDVGQATSSKIGDLLYGVPYYFAATAYDTSGNESDFSNEVTKTGVLPAPTGPEIIGYPAIVAPLTGASLAMVRPLAVGDIGRGIFCLQVGLPPYSSAVDIYLAVYAPDVDPSEAYFFTPDRLLSPLSSGVRAWAEGVIAPVRETLYCDIRTSALPRGAYTFFLIVTRMGRHDLFHAWITEFSLH